MRLAVVGEGLSGAVAAVRLLEASDRALALTLVRAGATEGDAALLPVPAGALSLYPEAPLHFARWLQSMARRSGRPEPKGRRWAASCPLRARFSPYVAMRLAFGVADDADRALFVEPETKATRIGVLGGECVVACVATAHRGSRGAGIASDGQ